MFAEPLSGYRQATARSHRTKADWAEEVAALLDTRYTDNQVVTKNLGDFVRCSDGVTIMRQCRILAAMYTIFETSPFTQIRRNYWNDEEYGDFCRFLAENPEAGDVVPKSGGVRKVRWALPGTGKSGGVRVIYF